jgi:hypothetical protein
MEKKLTKRDYFTKLRAIVANDAELVAFIDHEIELLTRKNASGTQTKTQAENVKIAEMLLQELAKVGSPITITDLMNKSEVIANYRLENGHPLSNQKISAIFKQLVDNKEIIKVVDKKKSYFSVAN